MGLFKKMFDQSVEGKGVLKGELTDKFTLLKFFRLSGRKFFRIAGLNLLFILTNLPAIAILFYLAGYGSVSRATPLLPYWFGPIRGASEFVSNPVSSLLYGLSGTTIDGSYNGTWSYILLGVAALTLLTFGPANTGLAYVLRNYTREEPCELWADYWRSLKKNLRQSVLFGAVDLFLLGVMAYDLFLFLTGQGTAVAVFSVIAVATGVIYIMMRNYFYVIMVTFELSVPKIVKNSLIFAFANVKRNLVGFLGIALCWAFTGVMLVFVTPFGALLLMTLLFSFTSFIGIYAAYPAIKQFMIDPVIEEERKKRKDAAKEKEQIFTDVG